ncbi:MAG: Spy/CpxP family protein refolding chaperone [Humidesulfovibrio sp.]|nr:Spy/CpxP family protein refolding chaperone [Humidesulfovibrio sp.]
MKKSVTTFIIVAALVSLSAFAFAAGPRGGKGAAGNRYDVNPEQRATIQKIIEAHQDKLYELREKIWAKHAELQALTASGKAEKSDIQSLIADISKLRDAMHQERQAIRTEIEKQTGLKAFGPGGYHHGMGGSGYNCPGDGLGRGFGGAGTCSGGNCN